MNILLKITNLPPSSDYVRIDSGKGYDFRWSKAHGAFTYAPKDQAEIEEIYTTIAAHQAPWVVVPAIDGDASAPAAPAVVETADEAEAKSTLITTLETNLAAATKRIDQLKRENADLAKQVEMLRADAKAQQEKAAKGKPGRKAKADAAPASDEVPDVPTE